MSAPPRKKPSPRKQPSRAKAPRLPFEGLKVADFSWVIVGPMTARYLGDYGATVVRVESSTKIETMRRAVPYKDGKAGVDRSGYFAQFNAGKYGMSLNLNHPRGPEVARRLIQWADVVLESYTPGTMARWGLDYEAVRKSRPDIIYFSTSQMGQSGPWASRPGYGTQLVSLAGFTNLIGWPDREPAGAYGPYTDFLNPPFGALSIIAALDYRRRTGHGQHIDLSQLEASLHMLTPWLLDCAATGRLPQRAGNRDPAAVPHGAYPCRGRDRWVAIAVTTEEQWRGLCSAMNDPEWAVDAKFSTFLARKRHEAELDQLLAQWTSTLTAEQAMSVLQAVGVPAGVVQSAPDLFDDQQLRLRNHFVKLEHSEIGLMAYDQLGFRLGDATGGPATPSPCLGQHNDHVYRDILGYSEEEVAELAAQGVLD